MLAVLVNNVRDVMQRNKQNIKEIDSGFSLVELLMVIAIIGILATVTYASLSGAREKTKDKSIGAHMQSLLVEANLYRSQNNSYTGFCVDTSTQTDELLAKITSEAPSAPNCQDNVSTFGVIVELHSGDYYCIDSTKAFGIYTQSNLTGGLCPNN
jgi:prepilin-type N-terminal cleavage/methylation domain-containing protein